MAYTDSVLRLSGSTNGAGILLTATSDPGTLIHTASAEAADTDMPGLLASCDHTTDVQVFFKWAGNVEKGPMIPFQKGPFRIMPPRALWGGESVYMWASVAGVIWVFADSGTVRLTTS